MENNTAELAALVERTRKGDKAASTELYEKMYDKLYFSAYKNVHNKEDAEDIVQEAFVRATESLKDLISNDCFTSWIYSVHIISARISFAAAIIPCASITTTTAITR